MLSEIRKVARAHRSKAKAIKKLGLDPQHLEDHLETWIGWPGPSMRKAALEVVRGKPKSKLAKLLAVEREWAQRKFRTKTVKLYRGVNGDYADRIHKRAQKLKQFYIDFYEASSWSDKKYKAEHFTGREGVIIKADIPVEYIITCHRSNDILKNGGENEFIVAFPEKKLLVKREQIERNSY